MKLRLQHVAIAVQDVAEALRFWSGALGLAPGRIEEVASEGVRVALLPAGGCRIELLEPLGPDSTVARYLERRGGGIHHLALEVDDLDAALGRLRGAGIRLAGEAPRDGAGGRRVGFLHPCSTGGVLVELVEARGEREEAHEIAPGAAVLVYLREPGEKLWGVLRKIEPAGVVLDGIELASFDDWVAQLERGEERAVGPSTLFVPMARVEKVLLDRPSGSFPSLAERFAKRTGRTVQEALDGGPESA